MLIVHAVPRDIDPERKQILYNIVKELNGEFDFVLAVPEGEERKYGDFLTRVDLLSIKSDGDDGNMLRNVYNYKRLFDKILPDVIHSYGSVCASLGSFLCSGRDTVAIKDYYTSAMLRRVFESLSPRIRLSLTLSYSPSDRQVLYRGGVRDGSIIELPYGVPVPEVLPNKLSRVSKTPLVIGCFGDSEECAVLLSAFAAVHKQSGALFYVCGPSHLGDFALHLAAAVGIGRRVVFFSNGSVPEECLAVADTFVFSSLNPDVIPIFAAEQMAYATPVILPDTSRCRDLVRCGTDGYLYSFGDSFSMAAEILRLLSSLANARAMGKEARMRVSESFDIKLMTDRLRSLYSSL